MSDFVKRFFEPFNKAVGNKKFNKLEYKSWKNLHNWSRDNTYKSMKIERDKYINHFGNTRWVWRVGPVDDRKSVPNPEVMHIDDGSFGSFLSERFEDSMNYTDSISSCSSALASAADVYITDKISTMSTSLADYATGLQYHLDYNDISIGGDYISDTNTSIDINADAININGESLETYIEHLVNKEKEKKEMKFGNFDFGPVSADVHMSMYGMAIKNASGVYVSYDPQSKQIMDVDILNFEGANKFMYKMPVAIKDVAIGDVIVHARKPMFVTGIYKDGRLAVVDPNAGEEKTIMLAHSPFGFNFVTKVISLLNFGSANADNPFGNLLPLMLMSDSKGNDNDALLMMAMMGNGTNSFANNPMMMYLLLGKDGKNSDILPLLLMSQCTNPAQPTGCNGNCSCHADKATD